MQIASNTEETYAGKDQQTNKQKNTTYRDSLYNPRITLPMLERIFGYSRQAFINWEKETGDTTPTLKAEIESTSKHLNRNRRLYTISDVRYLWNYFIELGKLPPRPILPISIAVWNNKGGVGKSCLSKELASIFSILMGYKTLVVDCDSQADCTLLMNCAQKLTHLADLDDEEDYQATIRDIIGWEDSDNNQYKCGIDEALIHLSPTLSVIPSDREMTYLTLELRDKKGLAYHKNGADISALTNIQRFLETLHAKHDYDIVIFDCNPDITEWVHNVLWSSDRLLLPVEIEPKCLHSLNNVYNHLKLIAQHEENYRFDKIVALPNKFHSGHDIDQDAIPRLKKRFPDIISKYMLPDTTCVKQADKEQRPLFMAAFSSERKNLDMVKRFTNQMWNVAHEILGQTPHKNFFEDVND